MEIEVKYHSIQSDHVLAVPTFTHKEIFEVNSVSDPALIKHICSKRDLYGHKFRKPKRDEKTFGFDYISNQGGVKIEIRKKAKKLK